MAKQLASRVPFNDLARLHKSLSKKFHHALADHLLSSDFINGAAVQHFAESFGETIGAPYVVPCGNGTDALWIALKSLGVGPGDEVIVPAHTWVSTAEAVVIVGAAPVFCDIDPYTYTIDTNKLPSLINKKTKCIIPVHLAGNPCDMNALMKIATQNNIFVVEDCAQGHLTYYEGKHVGLFGDIGTFSFYPGKNLGCLGDGGCLVTKCDNHANNAYAYANHGIKPDHQISGVNSRLDSIQASFLSIKLPFLRDWTDERCFIADMYIDKLSHLEGLVLPAVTVNGSHSWHQFMIRTPKRDFLQQYLNQKQIMTSINYLRPLNTLNAFKNFRGGKCNNAETVCDQIISLPLFPGMSPPEISMVIYSVKTFFDEVYK